MTRQPRVQVRIDTELHRQVRIAAVIEGISMEAWLDRAIKQALDSKQEERK